METNAARLQVESAKLQNALDKIANIHVQRYARIIRNNAATKARIGYVPANALAAQQKAEQQAAASTAVATQTPVNQTTQTAEQSAVNAVLSQINSANKAANYVKSNAYAKLNQLNKNKVNSYLKAQFPSRNVPVTGSPNGRITTLVKNGPNKPWRFRNQVPYYLNGANSNNPTVYLTYGQRPRNKFLGFL